MVSAREEPQLDPEELAQLRKGAEEFNRGHFFECHDTLEEVWQGIRGPARDFFQGLIQIAVGFYHMDNGNLPGAASQLSKGLHRLECYPQGYLDVDLEQLRREAGIWLQKVRGGADLRAAVTDLPKIRFQNPR